MLTFSLILEVFYYLGLTFFYNVFNRVYGAVAALERTDVSSVPTPDIRVHNLTFDLNAYGNDGNDIEMASQGFHLKIFGSVRHRYMALAIQKCDSRLVKSLKVVLDQSVSKGEDRWALCKCVALPMSPW